MEFKFRIRKMNVVKSINSQKNIYQFIFFLIFLILILLLPEKTLSQNVVNKIIIEGNKRIASSTIISISDLNVRSNLSNEDLNNALIKLKSTSFFKTVTLNRINDEIFVKVIEHPTINSINFEGNVILNDDALILLISSEERQTLQPSKIEKDAEKIAKAYAAEGRIHAQIIPKIIEKDDNRVELIFEINEGIITEIEKITFIGNRSYSDFRLKGILATKQAGVFRNLIKSDTFIEDRFDYDAQLIQDFYVNRGFVDFKLISNSAKLTRSKNAFLLNFTMEEGQQYKFGKVSLKSSIDSFDEYEFEKLLNIKTGNNYDPRKIDKLVNKIDIAIAKKGVNFVRILPEYIKDDDDLVINIIIKLLPAQKIFIERIEIEGNSTTIDEVIRMKFDLAEGDAFNRRKITEASDKIRALGFFSDVNISTKEGSSPDKIIVLVKLKEKPTGSLGIGAGYNSSDGSVLTFNVNERNFLGKGQTLNLALSSSSIEKEMTVRFEDPSYLGRNLLAGISLGTKTSTPYYAPLSIDNSHFAPKIKFPLSRDSSLSIIYRLDNDDIKLSSNNVDISPIIQTDVGKKLKSGMIFSYNIDKTNSPISPTSGFDFEIKQELNGLAGDVNYSKTGMKFKYFNALFNDNIVVSTDFSSGAIIGSDANIINRFSLGGDKLRGFRSYGVGPVDNTYVNSDTNGDPLGGKMFTALNIQASFPIGIPEEYGVFGGVFLGAGSVWGLDQKKSGSNNIDDTAILRSAAGISVFWDTMIGPLRFNFSRPISKELYDVTENFRFTVDTRF